MKIVVIGGGSWGTALAKVLTEKGHKVSLLVRRKEVEEAVNRQRENTFYLPGIKLPEGLKATLNPDEAFFEAELAFWVVPSFALKEVVSKLKPLAEKVPFHISGIKGIDFESEKTPYFILKESLPSDAKVLVLGGPSFAKEVAQKLPTAVVLAADEEEVAKELQQAIAMPYFRVYRSPDPVGVEIAGALKNVIAIASGISDGLELGLNARAGLITRGLVELVKLGIKLGGKPTTFYGLAGVGDLLLTCTGNLSRNYRVGYALGKGKHLKEILQELKQVAEGVKTSAVVYSLAKRLKVELPICEAVYSVLYKGESPRKCLERLLSRSLKSEFEGLKIFTS